MYNRVSLILDGHLLIQESKWARRYSPMYSVVVFAEGGLNTRRMCGRMSDVEFRCSTLQLITYIASFRAYLVLCDFRLTATIDPLQTEKV